MSKDNIESALKHIIILLLFGVLFHINVYGQTSTSYLLDSINTELVEKCFGYKLVKCDMYSYRSSRIRKNESRIKVECNELGQIEKAELVFNNNHSLEIENFEECLLPYITMRPMKTRYQRIGRNVISITFDSLISEENEYYAFKNSLESSQAQSINYYKEEKKMKSPDWDLNVSKFNRLELGEVADSIFLELENSTDILMENYLKGFKEHSSSLERTKFANKSRKEFEFETYQRFLFLLAEYFEGD